MISKTFYSGKIGILGGTLDPIHNGHLIMVEYAKKQLNLDKVIFMPTGNPPHKNINNITDSKIRSSMVKIAIENILIAPILNNFNLAV